MPAWVKLAGLALQISIVAQVFAIGLRTTWRDATYLFRAPRLLGNSILARNVAVPVVAILLIKIFSFHAAIAITLGVLAVTPVPPLLPRSQLRAGARSEYVLGLLVSQSILAIVLVPVTVELMDWALGAQAHFSVVQVAQALFKTILLPLAAGMLALRFLPKLKHLAPQLLMVGSVLLIAGALPLLLVAWKAFGTLSGDGSMLALALFVIAGTAVGHFLGGPLPEDRTVLAIATSSRHPGLALAIAKANFPEYTRLVAGAVVIYLIFRLLLAVPYMRWRRHAPLGSPRPQAPPVHFPPGLAGPRR
jgi:BASS family bile acid:Na+ symporter